MSKKPPKRSPEGTPPPNYPISNKPPKRSPIGTPPPGILPRKNPPPPSPLLNPVAGILPSKYDQRLHSPKVIRPPIIIKPPQLSLTKPLIPLKIVPNSFLIIVDTYNWAWDIASRELLKAMPESKGRIVDINDFRTEEIDVRTYNVVLVYPWADSLTLNRLDPRNTVVNIAGGDQFEMLPLFERFCHRFNYYGVCNENIKELIAKKFPDKKVFTLTHGVDTELFSPRKRVSKRKFKVGWVGRCERGIKRFDLAKKITKQHNFNLLVAGYKSRPHDKMPNFYRSVDCLLVTSVTEAHPMVVYEAMSCEVPVITTDVGDVSRYIIDGKNGFILPIDAPVSEFAEKINVLKNNVKFRKKMGKRARKTIHKRLSWAKIAEQYKPLTEILGVE